MAAFFVAAALILTMAGTALALTPTEQVKDTIGGAFEILKDKTRPQDVREEELLRLIFSSIDQESIVRSFLGTHWREISPAYRREFLILCLELIQRFYITANTSFDDVTVIYNRERVIDAGAQEVEVQTLVRTARGDAPVNYRLRRVGGEWKIYDINVEGISLVGNYRSQFDRLLKKMSPETLLRFLKERVNAPDKGPVIHTPQSS